MTEIKAISGIWKITDERQYKIYKNLGLAQKIAWAYAAKTNEPFEELYLVAVTGLILALDRFDATKGKKLSSFVCPYIRGEILHYLRDERKPGGVNVSRLYNLRLRIKPLDAPMIANDPDSPPAKDALETNIYSETPEGSELRLDLLLALEKLPKRQSDAIKLHFFEGIAQNQISERWGVSSLYINRLIKKGLKTLAEELKEYN